MLQSSGGFKKQWREGEKKKKKKKTLEGSQKHRHHIWLGETWRCRQLEAGRAPRRGSMTCLPCLEALLCLATLGSWQR